MRVRKIEYILIIISIWIVFNIIVYIPDKIKQHEERMLLHFKEINLRIDNLEKIIKEKNDIAQ